MSFRRSAQKRLKHDAPPSLKPSHPGDLHDRFFHCVRRLHVLEAKLNKQLHPVFQTLLNPWINGFAAYNLAAEAQNRIDKGEDKDRLVHILRDPDGNAIGLSTSFHPDADLSGYTEKYRTLQYYSGRSR